MPRPAPDMPEGTPEPSEAPVGARVNDLPYDAMVRVADGTYVLVRRGEPWPTNLKEG